MSRLYASIDSDARKTQATSRGHKHIITHTRGWDTGVEVMAWITDDDKDAFDIRLTGGSSGAGGTKLIATVVDGKVTFPIAVQYPIDRAKAQEGFTS